MHDTIEVTRTVTVKYLLRPGAYPDCSNEDVIKREIHDYDLTDFAITLRYRKPDEVDMKVSFQVVDGS